VRAQDERAFEEFVARTANRLLLSAVLLTGGDRAAGEDLLQGAAACGAPLSSGLGQRARSASVRRTRLPVRRTAPA